VKVCGGRWWTVYYEDGTWVTNETRKCRTRDDVLRAVEDGQGDCDWRDQDGQPVCYNNFRGARVMMSRHGDIVDIQHNP
jgi:hypothetical protein